MIVQTYDLGLHFSKHPIGPQTGRSVLSFRFGCYSAKNQKLTQISMTWHTGLLLFLDPHLPLLLPIIYMIYDIRATLSNWYTLPHVHAHERVWKCTLTHERAITRIRTHTYKSMLDWLCPTSNSLPPPPAIPSIFASLSPWGNFKISIEGKKKRSRKTSYSRTVGGPNLRQKVDVFLKKDSL